MPRPKPVRQFHQDGLPVEVYDTSEDLGIVAAEAASDVIRRAIEERGVANAIMATGNAQAQYFRALRDDRSIDWSAVNLFMIDQYLGLDPNTAGTEYFLRRHLLDFVTPRGFYPMSASRDRAKETLREYDALLDDHPLDLATVGWGENGHLAFNDPHNADFEDPDALRIVELSPESRQQPVSEGRFPSVDAVPTHAITLTIPAILSARNLLCIVPEARKARAVRSLLTEPVSTLRPGSVLRTVSNARLFLDRDSAAELA